MIIQIIKNALKRFRNNLSPPNIIDNSASDDNDSQNSPCNAYYIAQSKYNLRQYKLVLWDWCNTLYYNDIHINNSSYEQSPPVNNHDTPWLQPPDMSNCININDQPDNISRDAQINDLVCGISEHAIQGIISNGRIDEILENLQHMPWSSYIHTNMILTPSDAYEPKPHPHMCYELMDRCDMTNAKCILFIGDSKCDEEMAKQVQCSFIHIDCLTSYHP
jgi:hypothetical protein